MIRVLIVDDSAAVRKILTDELGKFPDIEVVGTAVDPYVAREKIVALQPDVLTLDVEMPRMDGLSFLAKLMKYHPMPVVVVSSLTQENSEAAMRALQLGAIDVIPKPGGVYSVPDVARVLVRALRAAAAARVIPDLEVAGADAVVPERLPTRLRTTDRVLAIGASTGGTTAIETLLRGMPATCPGTVIVQHMPGKFTAAFARRLDSVCAMEVREARDGDDVSTGTALVAPSDAHIVLHRSGARYWVQVKGGPRVHYQRPSVDVLFHSVAQSAGPNAIGVLLTGMGSDGAKGLLAMREAGAHTIAEAERSCVVFGMPREAIALGAAVDVLPLPRIASRVLQALDDPVQAG